MLLQMVKFISFYGWVVFLCVCVWAHVHVPQFLYPFICGWTLRCLDSFHLLATINNAAMNVGIHVSFWISLFFFFWYIPRSRITGSCVVLFLVFLRKLFSAVAAPIYILTNSLRGSSFLHSLTNVSNFLFHVET